MSKYKVGDSILVKARVGQVHVNPLGVFYTLERQDRNLPELFAYEDEIYSEAPEFNHLEEIEVSDDPDFRWFKIREYLFTNKKGEFPYITAHGRFVCYSKYARKLQKKPEENMVRDGVVINGKSYKLVEAD